MMEGVGINKNDIFKKKISATKSTAVSIDHLLALWSHLNLKWEAAWQPPMDISNMAENP